MSYLGPRDMGDPRGPKTAKVPGRKAEPEKSPIGLVTAFSPSNERLYWASGPEKRTIEPGEYYAAWNHRFSKWQAVKAFSRSEAPHWFLTEAPWQYGDGTFRTDAAKKARAEMIAELDVCDVCS